MLDPVRNPATDNFIVYSILPPHLPGQTLPVHISGGLFFEKINRLGVMSIQKPELYPYDSSFKGEACQNLHII